MDQVTVWAPATTANLGPGFDALGMALSLYNVVELAFAEKTTVEIEAKEPIRCRATSHTWCCPAQPPWPERRGWRFRAGACGR